MIHGNTTGIRQALLHEMEALYDFESNADEFCPLELLFALAKYTGAFNREVCCYLDRNGKVMHIAIGDSGTVELEEIRTRRNLNRLSGVRCIHTHPNGDPEFSDVDLHSLEFLKFDAMAVLSVREDQPSALHVAYLGQGDGKGHYSHVEYGPFGIYQIPQSLLVEAIYDADRLVVDKPAEKKERPDAVLIGLCQNADDPTMQELRQLAETAEIDVVDVVTQYKTSPDPGCYIGTGKAEELGLLLQAMDVTLVIADDELTSVQSSNLQKITGCDVLDRTLIILDIFARRATTYEGKLQVELAQLKYRYSHLAGLGTQMSRVGGGGGGLHNRGQGETRLEMDRRRLRKRIEDIEKSIAEMKKRRDYQRERRDRERMPVVALVGYTNAGKSTLLNQLSGADALAEDMLFATLDPVMRRCDLPNGGSCLLVDTVGFIDKLPHDLVDAFRSTLEEAAFADLLVIVADASDEDLPRKQTVVDQVLQEVGAGEKPRIVVLNKADRALPGIGNREEGLSISAKNGDGCPELLLKIEKMLSSSHRVQQWLVPYARGDVMAYLHKYAKVQGEEYREEGTLVSALVDASSAQRIQSMLDEN